MKKASDVFKSIRFAKGESRDKPHSSTDDEAHYTVGEKEFKQQLKHVKKASHDVAHKGALTRQYSIDSNAAKKSEDYVQARKSDEKANKMFDKSWNRRKNMAKAVDRLAKEEVEQIEEREMTDAEMKKREEIVKGMKKSLAGFKDRYGERAKSVMYATATKQAMKD